MAKQKYLSEHFTLEELTVSSTALRHSIANKPDALVIGNLKMLCSHVLEPLRQHFGIVLISSGYRCLEINRIIGSKDTSQHIKGYAVDIIIPDIAGKFPVKDVIQTIKRINLELDQCINEYNQWTHISYVHGNNRKQFLKIG